MPSCRKYERMISADIDGELTPEEEQEMQAHLATCGRCRALKIEVERICASVRVMDTVPAPKNLSKEIMTRVQEAPKSKIIHLFQKHCAKPAAGIAACVVFCACLYGVAIQGRLNGVASNDVAPKAAMYSNRGEDGLIASRTIPEIAIDSASSSVVRFDQLPDGWEDVLSEKVCTDGCVVPQPQAKEFLELLDEQKISYTLEGDMDAAEWQLILERPKK